MLTTVATVTWAVVAGPRFELTHTGRGLVVLVTVGQLVRACALRYATGSSDRGLSGDGGCGGGWFSALHASAAVVASVDNAANGGQRRVLVAPIGQGDRGLVC